MRIAACSCVVDAGAQPPCSHARAVPATCTSLWRGACATAKSILTSHVVAIIRTPLYPLIRNLVTPLPLLHALRVRPRVNMVMVMVMAMAMVMVMAGGARGVAALLKGAAYTALAGGKRGGYWRCWLAAAAAAVPAGAAAAVLIAAVTTMIAGAVVSARGMAAVMMIAGA